MSEIFTRRLVIAVANDGAMVTVPDLLADPSGATAITVDRLEAASRAATALSGWAGDMGMLQRRTPVNSMWGSDTHRAVSAAIRESDRAGLTQWLALVAPDAITTTQDDYDARALAIDGRLLAGWSVVDAPGRPGGSISARAGLAAMGLSIAVEVGT